VLFAGQPIAAYLEFPPLTRYVVHAGFSWTAFAFLGAMIAGVATIFIAHCLKAQGQASLARPAMRRPFPWWGWVGLVFLACAWILAWTRFDWFAGLQPFTFTPLWLGYILVVNAWSYCRKGQCMLIDQPRFFASLFALSAGFWWYFEYLNRFVQNWYYEGISQFTAFEYFMFATLPFATVLPAVLGTAGFLETFPRLGAGLDRFWRIRLNHSKPVALAVFILSCLTLLGIGVWPDMLFPLIWLSPLLMIVSWQAVNGQPTTFSGVSAGDWRKICLLALAALICGFFWEMWNYYSLAKWKYSVPFVERFRIFEMPVLGYAGYLPFGLGCAVFAEFILSQIRPPRGRLQNTK